MAILSDFETDGVWRIVGGGLVHNWSAQPEFVPTELDVPFRFNPEYNWGLPLEEREVFRLKYRILRIKEIVEVYREPHSDVDGTFKGRTLQVANFRNETDALFFKIAMS